MPRNKDEPPAVRVYTVCDESKYLIVRNVPALGCGDELRKLFGGYGEIDEFLPLDDEDCEPFTDVYWIKFHQINNARLFAKRKLDESVFIGNRLQVSYAPQYESLSDTKEKLDIRRKDVLARHNRKKLALSYASKKHHIIHSQKFPSTVSSNQDYFPVESMNQTVRLVREKLNKIEADSETLRAGSSKRPRNDNRRRI
ncbi:hypothetical protein E3N88_37303 [Mikania micrantha]|uniref:RNA-binding protein 48 n=1 Tax=Mikania micrantha TaxID=192012 RepID=A0A5N6LQP9_9ASTR|nr:hypothetical protein E3N88_37303 [Mikania micrantha]